MPYMAQGMALRTKLSPYKSICTLIQRPKQMVMCHPQPLANETLGQRFFGNLTLVVDIQFMELAACMRNAACFDDALLEQVLVAAEVVTT